MPQAIFEGRDGSMLRYRTPIRRRQSSASPIPARVRRAADDLRLKRPSLEDVYLQLVVDQHPTADGGRS